MASASASAAARLCILTCRRAPRLNRLPHAHRIIHQTPAVHRALSTTTARWAIEKEMDDDDPEEDLRPIVLKKLDAAIAEDMTPEKLTQLDELAKEHGFNTIEEYIETTLDRRPGWASEDRAVADELMRDDIGEKPNKQSFWYDEEDPETNTEELDDFNEDDITSMAHGKLDEVREMRQYARLAVWEMPLLSKLAKPFRPPTDDQVLRWRYTSYMGEFHPAEKKVVVQFAPDDLKLTPVQTEKLKKLAGVRYNPEKELIKISCESFEHQAQNKRYLSKLVDELITAAKDPKDTFEDVPLDVRHHVFRPKPKFPVEWRMTAERLGELDSMRQQQLLADADKGEKGLLVDGPKVIDEYLAKKALEEQKKAQMAEVVASSTRSGGNRARR